MFSVSLSVHRPGPVSPSPVQPSPAWWKGLYPCQVAVCGWGRGGYPQTGTRGFSTSRRYTTHDHAGGLSCCNLS